MEERIMALSLSRCIVDLYGSDRHDQAVEPARVGHVPVMQRKARALEVLRMGVLQVVDTAPVHGRRTAHHAVHLVSLLQEELGEVGAVLTGDAGNQRALGHGNSVTTVTGTGACPSA